MKSITIDIPPNIKKQIEELLWFNNTPSKFKIAINSNVTFLDIVLKQIMVQIGTDASILNTKCIVLCGPTGVGKTKFLNYLKSNYKIETINMDTMQIYNYISVGTGRTDLSNTKGSYVYGTYDPNKEFNIIDYLSDVFISIKKINSYGSIPLFEGASKSLLDIIMRIFSNVIIFGIKAVNDENIVSNITKRISKDFCYNSIKELSYHIIKGHINYDSPVLKKNWVVYNLIISSLTKKQLLNKQFIKNIDDNFINKLTKICVKYNIKLHKAQLKRLSKIKNIIWFTNDEKSIKKLEQKFIEFTKK